MDMDAHLSDSPTGFTALRCVAWMDFPRSKNSPQDVWKAPNLKLLDLILNLFYRKVINFMEIFFLTNLLSYQQAYSYFNFNLVTNLV